MRKTVRLLLLALFLLAGIPTAFAQVKGAFAIVCNTTGARVYLSGELVGYTKPTFSMLLKPGKYTVKVTAKGYKDYTTSIQMTANPLNLEVNLEPVNAVSKYPLSVSANVAGAQVFVNNSLIGSAPASISVPPGSYTIKVTAPGYYEYTAVVAVKGYTAHNAMLLQQILRLSVNANVTGAQLYINNALAGTIPFHGQLVPGSYTLRVTAPGYLDAGAVIALAKNETVSFSLQPAMATVKISVNPMFLDPQNKNALSQVKIAVDGKNQNAFGFQLPAGRHNIRISSGGLSVAADYDIEPGRIYTIEPVLLLNFRQ